MFYVADVGVLVLRRKRPEPETALPAMGYPVVPVST